MDGKTLYRKLKERSLRWHDELDTYAAEVVRLANKQNVDIKNGIEVRLTDQAIINVGAMNERQEG